MSSFSHDHLLVEAEEAPSDSEAPSESQAQPRHPVLYRGLAIASAIAMLLVGAVGVQKATEKTALVLGDTDGLVEEWGEGFCCWRDNPHYDGGCGGCPHENRGYNRWDAATANLQQNCNGAGMWCSNSGWSPKPKGFCCWRDHPWYGGGCSGCPHENRGNNRWDAATANLQQNCNGAGMWCEDR